MAMETDGKVVQTVLSTEEYDRLRRVAEQEDKTLKELLREAASEYTRSHEQLDPEDSLFEYEPAGSTGDTVSARNTDDYLYGEE